MQTTPKEKAEEYVRKQIPELMELSFGCLIQYEDLDTEPDVVAFTTPQTRETQLLVHLVGDAPDKGIPLSWINRHSEIIGHPIQLHHWLTVLRPHCHLHYYHKNTIVAVPHGIDAEADEFEAVEFNLATGQPFGEANYQSFNTIVGI